MGRAFALAILTVILSPPLRAQTAERSGYRDSADGFSQQLEDLISAYKSGDQAAFQESLNALAIPNVNDWISAHFKPADVPKLQRDYTIWFTGYKETMTSFFGKAARTPGREMTVGLSEPPIPPSAILVEKSLPSPVEPIVVECFRYGPIYERNEIPSSWVSTFVYAGGQFRYVGGIFPFWWGTLQRGALSAGRLVHRVNPEYPKKAREQHVEGVVRIYAIIGKDGVPHSFTLVNGDPLLREAAIKAVQQWRYQPTLLSGVPVEVDAAIDVVFQLNRKH